MLQSTSPREAREKAGRTSRFSSEATSGLRHRPRLRRAGVIVALLFAAAALCVALAPWVFSPRALVEEVAGHMRTTTGLLITAKGRSTFSLLPRPHILMEGVDFTDETGGLTIEAAQLVGNLALPPLLSGKLEMAAIGLVRPSVELDLDRKPFSIAGAAARASQTTPSTPEALKADQSRLDVMTFVDGALRVKSSGRLETFEHVDATLDWRKVGQPATLTASFSWRNERPQILAWVARPGALLRGEQSPVTARFDSERAHIELEGVGEARPKPRYVGRVTASSPSLAQALQLFELPAPLPGPFENLRLTAVLSAGTRDLQLSNMRLLADDNEFEGVLSLRDEEGRPTLQASLSSNSLSLKPMLGDMPPLSGSDGQWSRETFELPDLSGADVDLRLHAAHAKLARMAMENVNFSIMLRDGRLDLAISDAHAYKGALKAQATITMPAENTVEAHATVQTSQMDAGSLLWDATGRPDFSGLMDANMTLTATGDSVLTLMRDLDGRATLTLTQGEISGIDLERALRRIDKRPLSTALNIRSGRSALERVEAVLEIAKGTAVVESATARGPGFTMQFSGSTRIPDRALAFKALAHEADANGRPRENGMQLGFDLTGDWGEPNFLPDAQALIKRSGAAAPLLPHSEPKDPGPPQLKPSEP
jgi:AsmA protein